MEIFMPSKHRVLSYLDNTINTLECPYCRWEEGLPEDADRFMVEMYPLKELYGVDITNKFSLRSEILRRLETANASMKNYNGMTMFSEYVPTVFICHRCNKLFILVHASYRIHHINESAKIRFAVLIIDRISDKTADDWLRGCMEWRRKYNAECEENAKKYKEEMKAKKLNKTIKRC